jgi:hypothetical protein
LTNGKNLDTIVVGGREDDIHCAIYCNFCSIGNIIGNNIKKFKILKIMLDKVEYSWYNNNRGDKMDWERTRFLYLQSEINKIWGEIEILRGKAREFEQKLEILKFAMIAKKSETCAELKKLVEETNSPSLGTSRDSCGYQSACNTCTNPDCPYKK